MAALRIPCGNQGLRTGPYGIGNRVSNRLFAATSPAKRIYLRRNGAVRVQFPLFTAVRAGRPGMNPASPRNVPVLGRQAIEMLRPRDGGIYVDATFGAGGYSRAILDTAGTQVIGIDRDRSAVSGGVVFFAPSGGPLALGGGRVFHPGRNLSAPGIASVLA